MITNRKDLIECYGIVHRQTVAAIYVDFGNRDCWLPKSQLEDWPDVGEAGEILLPEWLAIEKEIV